LRYRVNPSANNERDDTSSLLQSRHSGTLEQAAAHGRFQKQHPSRVKLAARGKHNRRAPRPLPRRRQQQEPSACGELASGQVEVAIGGDVEVAFSGDER